jgi:NADPH:quinone reductase-like Zn-dependent oxidoreductase
MKAAVMHALGKPPRFDEFPDPVPGEGESIVEVRAAALPRHVKMAANNPLYGGGRELPYVCGLEGLGTLEDGSRVIFYQPRAPYGSLAQYSLTKPTMHVPVPDGIDDAVAAALLNPGVTTGFALSKAGQLAEGGSVLILGATGFAGKLAIQLAKKFFGAGRVVAAGRDAEVLATLGELGADATIQLDQSDSDLASAFVEAHGEQGYDVILDYVWGRPAEVLLNALPRKFIPTATRFLQLGSIAGETVPVHADTLRRGGVSLLNASVMGSNYAEARLFMNDFQKQLLDRTAQGDLRIDVERVPLSDIENAWERADTMRGHRLVITP